MARPTAFKPGESGNPAGRPKGAVNKTTKLVNALTELLPTESTIKALALLMVRVPTEKQALEVLRTIRKLYKSQQQAEN